MTDLTVSLWNRDLILSEAQVERLQDFILDYLSKTPEGRESVSYLVDRVREGTKLGFPTRMVDAESMFEALGFRLERIYSQRSRGSVRRTDVTL